MFKLAIICGGPSHERGISLNSARSIMDHLKGPLIDIIPLFVDSQRRFYRISPAQLYSNTPADFDYKLAQSEQLPEGTVLQQLLSSVDLVFPVIHGAFGEDGGIQEILEKMNIPFIGHSSHCCKWMFKKHQAAETLRGHGFATFPQLVITKKMNHAKGAVDKFFLEQKIKRAIVKPASGGSSIGVSSVEHPQQAYANVMDIFEKGLDDTVLIEPFCEGKEFTVVVFDSLKGKPVAFIPTEVEMNYDKNQIFDFRRKYLPTNQTAYHTPPKWDPSIVSQIRLQAEQIFQLFGMSDFVRLDGWLGNDGIIYFTDINPISGLEQNSFLFRQASLLGMTQRQALEYIVKRACLRHGLDFPGCILEEKGQSKQPVYVLFGSQNAERQVSLMSGTNVWLKLLRSEKYSPSPFLFDPYEQIWELPYAYTLNHTVEEIYANCKNPKEKNHHWQRLIANIQLALGFESEYRSEAKSMSLNHFLDHAKRNQAFVFIALHGGIGEDGTLQKMFEDEMIPFNGSNSRVSALCMDKYMTGQAIARLAEPDLFSIPKKCFQFADIKKHSTENMEGFWEALCCELESRKLVVKPRSDGCSAGIVSLQSAQDLEKYLNFMEQKDHFIPAYSFVNQKGPIEMPTALSGEFLLEPYIETDAIEIESNRIKYVPKEGWIELTVGVLEDKGSYHAMNPSITIAEGAILSLEEKFQGGTGINLTPPPIDILSLSATEKIKRLTEKAAHALGIQNYARLDIFFNRNTEQMILIEANTLPGLTPSTVIFHQALAETPSMPPLVFLDRIISSKIL